MASLRREFVKGFTSEIPIFGLFLGLCPTLAVTTNLSNGVGMGAATLFVLVASNVIISAMRRWIPPKIRIPCFIVVIATFVTIVKLTLAAFLPDLDESLGIFVALIVVNCIVLGRAEAFASRTGVLPSLVDGLGMGIGFILALLLVSGVREVLGAWSVWGLPISQLKAARGTPGVDPIEILVQAPGAFLVLGFLLTAFALVRSRRVAVSRTADARAAIALEPEVGPAVAKRRKAEAAAKKKAAAEKQAQKKGPGLPTPGGEAPE